MNHESNTTFFAKLGSVWGAMFITSWSELAGFLGTIYTLWMIGQKAWRELVKPYLKRKGFIRGE